MIDSTDKRLRLNARHVLILTAAKDFEAKHMQSQLYRKVCLHFGVTPASYYLRHINDTELVMKHQGLGPKGTKALTVPLQVRGR